MAKLLNTSITGSGDNDILNCTGKIDDISLTIDAYGTITYNGITKQTRTSYFAYTPAEKESVWHYYDDDKASACVVCIPESDDMAVNVKSHKPSNDDQLYYDKDGLRIYVYSDISASITATKIQFALPTVTFTTDIDTDAKYTYSTAKCCIPYILCKEISSIKNDIIIMDSYVYRVYIDNDLPSKDVSITIDSDYKYVILLKPFMYVDGTDKYGVTFRDSILNYNNQNLGYFTADEQNNRVWHSSIHRYMKESRIKLSNAYIGVTDSIYIGVNNKFVLSMSSKQIQAYASLEATDINAKSLTLQMDNVKSDALIIKSSTSSSLMSVGYDHNDKEINIRAVSPIKLNNIYPITLSNGISVGDNTVSGTSSEIFTTSINTKNTLGYMQHNLISKYYFYYHDNLSTLDKTKPSTLFNIYGVTNIGDSKYSYSVNDTKQTPLLNVYGNAKIRDNLKCGAVTSTNIESSNIKLLSQCSYNNSIETTDEYGITITPDSIKIQGVDPDYKNSDNQSTLNQGNLPPVGVGTIQMDVSDTADSLTQELSFNVADTPMLKMREVKSSDGKEYLNEFQQDVSTGSHKLQVGDSTTVDDDVLNVYGSISFGGNNINSLKIANNSTDVGLLYENKTNQQRVQLTPYGIKMATYKSSGEETQQFQVSAFTGQTTIGMKNSNSGATLLTVYGHISANSATINKNSDFAEYFEWYDGNILNENRIGYFVTVCENGKIKKAQFGSNILGITSSTPGVIGNAAEISWCNKYATDDIGLTIYDEKLVPESQDSDGSVIPEHTEKVARINPEYDENKEYIPRSKRPEWVIVGLLGQIYVYDDGTCIPGKYCVSNDEGKATLYKSEMGDVDKYMVLSRLTDHSVRVLMK